MPPFPAAWRLRPLRSYRGVAAISVFTGSANRTAKADWHWRSDRHGADAAEFLPLQKIEHRRKRSDLPTANVSRCRNEKFDLGILARQERDDRHSGRYDRRRIETPTLHVAVERSIQFRIGQLVAGVSYFVRNLLQPVSRFVVSIGGSDVWS